jgi:hypothetical protein
MDAYTIQKVFLRIDWLDCAITVWEPNREKSLITARLQFMHAVKIKRWKFDQLVNQSKIRVVKKKCKIYMPVCEVERYLTDSKIQ